MQALSTTADRVRAAVAAHRATEPAASPLFVVLEEARDGNAFARETKAPLRILVRRLYAGENKGIGQPCTVAVGYDLASNALVAVTVDFSARAVVSAVPPGEGRPFEGVFDLKALEIERVVAGR